MAGPAGFIKKAGFSGENWTGEPAAFILTGFCNLRCPWCFAAELVLEAGRTPSLGMDEALAELSKLREKSGLLIVSGGEPTLFRGLFELLPAARGLGFEIAVETNGTQPDILARLMEDGLMDRAGLDVKARLDDEAYSRACGVDVPADLIRESIEVLRGMGGRVAIRSTVVPGLWDKEDVDALGPELSGFSRWIVQDFASGSLIDPEFVAAPAPDAAGAGELRDRAAAFLPALRFTPSAYE